MPGHQRDRNDQGRPEQARPRDKLGRPLPYGAEGVEPVPEDPLPPREAIAFARALADDGRHFSAHEVLEARWKAGPQEERDLWQGLAQICVGITHAHRGNPVGSERLIQRGVDRLRTFGQTGLDTYGLDLDAVVRCALDQVPPHPRGSAQGVGQAHRRADEPVTVHQDRVVVVGPVDHHLVEPT